MRDSQFFWALQTKAWITFTIFNLIRIYQFGTKQGQWYRKQINCSDLKTIDEVMTEEEEAAAKDCLH